MPLDDARWVEDEAKADTVMGTLLRGRARIAAGWCQNGWHYRGKYCAVGAISLDAKNWGISGQMLFARDWLERALPSCGARGLIHYNDAPGRTQADILALYDRAIALCREEADHAI